MNILNHTNEDSDLGTVVDPQTESSPKTNYLLLGDYYLIQLERYEPNTGLISLKYNKYTSDSGREAAELDSNAYLPKGTILQIGSQASNPDNLKVGDKVYISHHALTPHFQFFEERDDAVISFTGVIKVNLPHIEALILN